MLTWVKDTSLMSENFRLEQDHSSVCLRSYYICNWKGDKTQLKVKVKFVKFIGGSNIFYFFNFLLLLLSAVEEEEL
jgi:hypothetical protein